MSFDAEQHAIYKLANAEMRFHPSPHIYVEDMLPAPYYRRLIAHFPDAAALRKVTEVRPVTGENLSHRSVLLMTPENLERLADPARTTWSELAAWLLGPAFAKAALAKFRPFIEQRFKDQKNVSFVPEAQVVADRAPYHQLPHTDAPGKVMALLFYLPADEQASHLGTSLYVPKQPGFTCPGTGYHPAENFHRAFALPFRPNALFAFLKTATSFHGVERLTENDPPRRLILWDLRYAIDGAGQRSGAPP